MIRRVALLFEPAERTRYARTLALLTAAALAEALLCAAAVPVIRALAESRASAHALLSALVALALWIVLQAWSVTASRSCGYGLSKALHRRLADRVASLPLGWFTRDRTGQFARLCTGDVMSVMSVPAHLLQPLVSAVVTPLAMVLVIAWFSPPVAVAAAVLSPLLYSCFRWGGQMVVRSDAALATADREATDRVLEHAYCQPLLRMADAESSAAQALDRSLVGVRDQSRRMIRLVLPGTGAFTLAVQLTLVALLAVVVLVAAPQDPVTAAALLLLSVRFAEPARAAAELGAALRMSAGALDRIDEVLDTEPLPQVEHGPRPSAPGRVELRRVGVEYLPGLPVLQDFSLVCEPGTMTALVGRSGSGKSTVLRAVARFFDVADGAVLVGGVDVRERPTAELVGDLAMVFQDVHLFDGTLLDNVLIARPEADAAELDRALQLSGCTDLIARLPHGVHTQVGEGGSALSGGERQRVSIARALIADAPILLLDEATSALDAERQAEVTRALRELARDRTVLVVAHRLQTIRQADQIVVIDDGRVVERGTHDTLLAAGGAYAELWDLHATAGTSNWTEREEIL